MRKTTKIIAIVSFLSVFCFLRCTKDEKNSKTPVSSHTKKPQNQSRLSQTGNRIDDPQKIREALKVTQKLFMYVIADAFSNEALVNEANIIAERFNNDDPSFRDYYLSLDNLFSLAGMYNYDINSKISSLQNSLLTPEENYLFTEFYLSGQMVQDGFEMGFNQSYRDFRPIAQNVELYAAIEQFNDCKLGLLDQNLVRTDVDFGDSADATPAWIVIVKPVYGNSNYNYVSRIIASGAYSECGKKCRFGGISKVCGDYSDGEKCKCADAMD
jgi:hypothetical protein